MDEEFCSCGNLYMDVSEILKKRLTEALLYANRPRVF